RRFGGWGVLARHPRRGRYGHIRWLCRCEHCGTERAVLGFTLRQGRSTNCGCERKKFVTTHGKSRARVYKVWTSKLQRCLNPNHHAYASYSKRGVCERWLIFETFYTDMGDPPDGLTLERIDNDGPSAPCQQRARCAFVFRAARRAHRQNATATAASSAHRVPQMAG